MANLSNMTPIPTDISPEISQKSKTHQIGVSKEDILMNKLLTFFKQDYNLKKMIPVICGTDRVSLRVLDWFVTNYSKTFNVIYNIKKGLHVRQVSVHNSYKAQLKTFSKKGFDPFCRRQRLFLEYKKDEGVETTMGQMNFFKWAIENKVMDYVETHFDEIVDDMNEKCGKPKDTRELSVTGKKSINQHDVKITLKFDFQ